MVYLVVPAKFVFVIKRKSLEFPNLHIFGIMTTMSIGAGIFELTDDYTSEIYPPSIFLLGLNLVSHQFTGRSCIKFN